MMRWAALQAALDCDGHGSHVASSAIGRAVGVAKEAHVVAVRVLDCQGSGSISDFVAGAGQLPLQRS
jgi:subtilisin family serine protease